MANDDDIAGVLPNPPLPAPARRQAAIEEALRRFDVGGEMPRAPAKGSTHPTPLWPRLTRQHSAAFASIVIVAMVGLPVAWLSMSEQPQLDRIPSRSSAPTHQTAAPDPRIASSTAVDEVADASPPGILVAESSLPEADSAVDSEPSAGPPTAPAPPPPAAEAVAAEQMEKQIVPGRNRLERRSAEYAEPVAESARQAPSPMPMASMAAPAAPAAPRAVAEAESGEIIVTSARRSAATRQSRGDWNACTVEDPRRSLSACGRQFDTSSKASSGSAAAPLADGLSLAWQGDEDGAIASFDKAIATAPRSSAAYLNRGLAHRRKGQLDRAVADLDRAIALAPGSARLYYNRSLIHRQRGDDRRARADEARAVELDRRYAPIVRNRR